MFVVSYQKNFYYVNGEKTNKVEELLFDLYKARLEEKEVLYVGDNQTLEFFNEDEEVYFKLSKNKKEKFLGCNQLPDCLQFALLLELCISFIQAGFDEH